MTERRLDERTRTRAFRFPSSMLRTEARIDDR
jgi:hypothetical protein